MREMLLRGRVGFVGCDDQVASRRPEHSSDIAVDGSEALPHVEQEDDHVGLVDGNLRLRLNRRSGGVFRAVQVKARGVDHRELPTAPVGDAIQPVSGEAGLGVDDRLLPADHAVEEGRLADVWTTDDRDDRPSHRSIRRCGWPQPQD